MHGDNSRGVPNALTNNISDTADRQWNARLNKLCTVKPVLRDHCHEGPPVFQKNPTDFWQKVLHFNEIAPVPKDTRLEKPHFYGRWGDPSRQVLLYKTWHWTHYAILRQ